MLARNYFKIARQRANRGREMTAGAASVPHSLSSGANCKTPAVFSFQGPFPLTPALSLRERENQGPRCNNSKRLGLSNALPMMLPLPEGEGRGEGEQGVRIRETCDFCNRLSSFGFLSEFVIRISDLFVQAIQS